MAQPNFAPAGAAAGKNAPYGASIEYWLAKEDPEPERNAEEEAALTEIEREEREKDWEQAKKEQVLLTVLDAEGKVVRKLTGTNREGMNRAFWDLRYEPTLQIRLRTTPEGTPTTVAGEGGSEELVVKKAPNSAASEEDVAAQTRLARAIYEDADAVVRMVNQLEWTRKQLEELRAMLDAAEAEPADRVVEDRLIQLTLAEADEKSFRGPHQLYLKLLWLQAEVGGGSADVSGGADFAPTRAEQELYELVACRLAAVRADFDTLYATTIPAFNQEMAAKGLGQLVTVSESDDRKPTAALVAVDDWGDWSE